MLSIGPIQQSQTSLMFHIVINEWDDFFIFIYAEGIAEKFGEVQLQKKWGKIWHTLNQTWWKCSAGNNFSSFIGDMYFKSSFWWDILQIWLYIIYWWTTPSKR